MNGELATDLSGLSGFCGVSQDREIGSWILKFPAGNAETTIRVIFEDRQSGADMVIAAMTTLPDAEKGKRFGSKALGILLAWAVGMGFKDIQAVQVQRPSERFWARHGFTPLRNRTNDFKYVPQS
jgi:hypothetical protein